MASACSSRCAARSRTCTGAGGCASRSRRRSRTGSSGASADGSTTPSFAPTPRRYGGSPGRRSRPSGRLSGSRSSASSTRCSGSSACNAASPKTLIEEFLYPRLGPGQMWEAVASAVEERGIPVELNRRCVAIRHDAGRVTDVVVETDGAEVSRPAEAVLSSMPLAELIECLEPAAPDHVREAARMLRYRNLCLVALMTSGARSIPRQLDLPARSRARRRDGCRTSAPGAPTWCRRGRTCLGVEYFCFEEDEIWQMSDADAVELAKRDLSNDRHPRSRPGLRRRQGPRAARLSDVRPHLSRGRGGDPRLSGALREPEHVRP